MPPSVRNARIRLTCIMAVEWIVLRNGVLIIIHLLNETWVSYTHKDGLLMTYRVVAKRGL
jgi:hypothetical protein